MDIEEQAIQNIQNIKEKPRQSTVAQLLGSFLDSSVLEPMAMHSRHMQNDEKISTCKKLTLNASLQDEIRTGSGTMVGEMMRRQKILTRRELTSNTSL